MRIKCVAHCAAVEVLLDREDEGFVLGNALDLVSPFPGDLYGSLDRFGARVHGQNHLEAQHLGDKLGEAGEDIIVKCARAESET